ncbi:MAG: GAF domain-containing protein, partial [Bacillota bacterium]
ASPDQLHSMQTNGFGLAHLTRLLVISDTRTAKAFPGAENLKAMHIRALLAMPIRRDSQEYGLICLVLDKPREWTTAEISLVKTTADIIMSAYQRLHVETGLRENMRVLTEYDESLQDLLAQKETLANVAQNFLRAGTSHFTECVPHTLRNIGQLLGADGIRILVRSTKEDTDAFSWREEGLPYRFGHDQGCLDAALRNAAQSLREPVAFDDMAEAHPLSELLQAGREEGLRSLLVVPACREDGLNGTIACYKSVGVKRWYNADVASTVAFFNIFLDAYRLNAGCASSEAIRLQG